QRAEKPRHAFPPLLPPRLARGAKRNQPPRRARRLARAWSREDRYCVMQSYIAERRLVPLSPSALVFALQVLYFSLSLRHSARSFFHSALLRFTTLSVVEGSAAGGGEVVEGVCARTGAASAAVSMAVANSVVIRVI